MSGEFDHIWFESRVGPAEREWLERARVFTDEHLNTETANPHVIGSFQTDQIELTGNLALYGTAFTEQHHGLTPAETEPTAEPDGDGYVVTWRKRWATNTTVVDVIVVRARDRSGDCVPVRGFVIAPDREGVSTEPIERNLSIAVSTLATVEFSTVWVPGHAVVSVVRGWAARSPFSPRPGTRSCGARLAPHGVVSRSPGRTRSITEQFGSPIAAFQVQQRKLADMVTQTTTARALDNRPVGPEKRGTPRPQELSVGGRNSAEMALETALTAREMLGVNGITGKHSPIHQAVNMEIHTHERTHGVHTLVCGEVSAGIAALETGRGNGDRVGENG